ncbi:MAG: TetR/AcrR family transcriptional regulator [Clostridiales bacterium]|jgi:AcrR family transcriptional regulator|nr:TetR/AcrR family transcriptional regulator [Clostridiales bacterium]
MRVAKEGQERKNEILDASEDLFFSKGYEKATVNDILDAVGISKGAFYYHFGSKEEVLDAIIRRRADSGICAANRIAADAALTAHEKLLQIMLAQKPNTAQQEQLVGALHEAPNALMHQKSLSEIILRLAPVLGAVVGQGIGEGVFRTPYPIESSEFILAVAQTIFDDGCFHWTADELARKIPAFMQSIERILGADEGSMSYIMELL